MFRDDALQLSLSARFEQGRTITIKLIAELNAALVIVSNESLQLCSTLKERLLAEVFAVEMQQVEGI